jgi:amino acid permease
MERNQQSTYTLKRRAEEFQLNFMSTGKILQKYPAEISSMLCIIIMGYEELENYFIQPCKKRDNTHNKHFASSSSILYFIFHSNILLFSLRRNCRENESERNLHLIFNIVIIAPAVY